jgi:hypothetical protein
MQLEREQATLLRKSQEALERLDQLGRRIERDARERRGLNAATALLLVVIGAFWFVRSGL